MRKKIFTAQKRYVLIFYYSLIEFFLETYEVYENNLNIKLKKSIEGCIKKGENLEKSLNKDFNPKQNTIKELEDTIKELEENCKELKTLMEKGIDNLKMYYKK